MSDEGKLADMDLAAAKKQPADATQPVPIQTPPQDKFGGKSPEQILAELEEKERQLKDLTERESRSKHEAEFLQSQLEQLRRGPQEVKPGAPEPTIPMPTDEDFILRPREANEKMVRRMLEMDRAERDRATKEERDKQARVSFEFGRTRAFRDHPQLYQGIEQEVAAAVVGAYQSNQADLNQLDKAEFWDNTAGMIRLLKGERNLEKYYTNVPTPVISTPTERPTANMPPQVAVNLTEEEKAMARKFNVTEERLAELKRNEAERAGR